MKVLHWIIGYSPLEAYALLIGATASEQREAIKQAWDCYRFWQRTGKMGPNGMFCLRQCIIAMVRSAQSREFK